MYVARQSMHFGICHGWLLASALTSQYISGSQTFWAADPFCCEIFFADSLAAWPILKLFRYKPILCKRTCKPTVKIRKAMEFFHISKIYSDGKNSSAITLKSEHARV